MRLLPRSRRGIGLFAAALWLALCAGLWWGLPVAPRAKWDAAHTTYVMGVLADGTLVTQDSPESNMMRNYGAIRLWNPETASEVLSKPLWDGEMKIIALSADRQGIIAHIERASPAKPKNEVRYYFHPKRQEFSVVASSHNDDGKFDWSSSFSPDGRFVAIHKAIRDPSVKDRIVKEWTEIWTCDSPRLHLTVEGAVRALSPDGRFIAAVVVRSAGAPDSSQPSVRSIVVWDVQSGKKVSEFTTRSPISSPRRFSPSGRTLAAFERPSARSGRQTIALFDWQSGTEIVRFEHAFALEYVPHSDDVIVLQYLPNHHWTLSRWDRAKGDYRYHGPEMWHPFQEGQFQLSPDGRIAAAAVGTGRKTIHESLRPILNSVKLSALGDIDATEEVVLLDTENGHELGRIPKIRDVVISPDGKTAFGARNREIQVWDIPPRKPLAWFAGGIVAMAILIAFVARRRVRSIRAGSVSDRKHALTPVADAPGSTRN